MTNEFDRREVQSESSPVKTRRSIREEPKTDQPIRWVQLRLIPIWLRIILVAILFIVVVAVGLTVGYSFIGDGETGDALKWSTWQHILDIMSGK
jgi:hypothetical protein